MQNIPNSEYVKHGLILSVLRIFHRGIQEEVRPKLLSAIHEELHELNDIKYLKRCGLNNMRMASRFTYFRGQRQSSEEHQDQVIFHY